MHWVFTWPSMLLTPALDFSTSQKPSTQTEFIAEGNELSLEAFVPLKVTNCAKRSQRLRLESSLANFLS